MIKIKKDMHIGVDLWHIVHIEPLKGAFTFEVGGKDVCLVTKHCNEYRLPRCALSKEDMKKLGVQSYVVRPAPAKFSSGLLKPKKGISLRDDQKDAWKATTDLIDQGALGGVLNLACGKGKTFLGLMAASYIGGKTLIVSPQRAHLDNWKSELVKFFDFKGTTGWVQGKKREWDSDIVFATVQTLASLVDKKEDVPDDFATIIFDECHGMSALHFSKAANMFSGFRLGLSATPNRTDRNEGIFLSHIGKVYFSDVTQQLLPVVKIVETAVFVPEKERKKFVDKGKNINLNLIRSWMATHKERNEVICDEIKKAAKEGRKIYVLSHIVEHIEELSKQFPKSTVIHGGIKSEDRLKLLNGSDIVFATIAIGKEAYNRAELDTLFLLTPFAAHKHAAIAYDQSVGRIQRTFPGKKHPEVFLFYDSDIPQAKALIMSLIRHSKRKKWEVKWM